jgi:hypothetical protein
MINSRYNDNVMEYARAIHFEMEYYPKMEYCQMLSKYAFKYSLTDAEQKDVTRCYALVYQGT